MSQAIIEKPPDSPLEQARKAKLKHAFWLARFALGVAAKRPEIRHLLLQAAGLYMHDVMDRLPNEKHLLVSLAQKWEIKFSDHLSHFSPVDIARLVHEFRKFLHEAQVGLPRMRTKDRDPNRLPEGEMLAKILDLIADLGWSEERFEQFCRKQLKGRATLRTEADARSVYFGLKGVRRHLERDTAA